MPSSPCLDAGVVGGVCVCGTLAFWPRIKKILMTKLDGIMSTALSGVKVSMRNLDVKLSCRGLLTVDIYGLTIGNVEGFKSENLAMLGSVVVVVDLAKAAKSALGSGGKPSEVEVVSVRANDCHFSFEKDSLTTSNFTRFLDKLGKQETAEAAEAPEEKAEAAEAPEVGESEEQGALTAVANAATGIVVATAQAVHSTATATARMASEAGKGEKKKEGTDVRLHHIDITHIVVEVISTSKDDASVGRTVQIADIKFEDFAGQYGSASPMQVIRLLVVAIMKGLLAGTMRLAEAGHEAFKGLEEAAESTWSYITSWFS